MKIIDILIVLGTIIMVFAIILLFLGKGLWRVFGFIGALIYFAGKFMIWKKMNAKEKGR